MRKLLLIALAWLLLLAGVARADRPISLTDLSARLERSAESLEMGRVDWADPLFDGNVEVQTPSGVMVLDLSWIDPQTPPDLRPALLQRMRSLARAARELSRTGEPELEARLKQAAADRELLDRILAGAGYREARLPGWWDRFWQGVRDWWNELWESIGITSGTGRVIGVGLVAAAVGAVLWLARDYLKLERWLSRGRGAGNGGAAAAPPRDPDALRAEAGRLAEAGLVAEAIRLLMQAVVGHLHRRRLVEDQPRLTGRSYVRELRRRRPDLAGALEELNALYEWKVYGQRPATAAEFRRAAELAGALWEEGSSSSAS